MTWTPKRVRETLVEAVTWAKQFAGPVGPSSVRSSMPSFRATLEDHLDEGWGLPELAGDDGAEDRQMAVPVAPERADFLMAALSWQAIYLVNPGNIGLARNLGLWLHYATARGGRDGFEAALKRRGVAKGHAYRLRDRALSQIAIGLTRDGVSDE